MTNGGPRRFLQLPWRSPARIQADVDEELGFDLDMRTAELVAQGLPEVDARRQAMSEFGEFEQTRRYCAGTDRAGQRDQRRTQWRMELQQDVRLAWRGMRRTPGFALVVLATLAVGIGANTAVFSVVSRVLIDRLPYRAPERLVLLYGGTQENPSGRGMLSAAEIDAMQRASRSLQMVAPFGFHGGHTYVSDDGAEMWQGSRVGPAFFRTLGVSALLGRTIDERDVGTEAAPVVVLSHAHWRRAFGGDSGIIDRMVLLNGISHAVIGVMPSTFVAPARTPEIWVPLDLPAILRGQLAERNILGVVARLADGATLDQARAELGVIVREVPDNPTAARSIRLANPIPVRDAMVGEARPVLLVVMGAAVLVLVVTCINVAGMFLARAAARRRELAVRAALGAGRWRLVRQQLTESLLIGLTGGIIGVVFAFWGKGVLVSVGDRVLPPMGEAAAINAPVLGFALMVSLTCGLAFGLVPAMFGARTDLNTALIESGRGAAGGRVRTRAGRVLVAGQVALAVIILVSAGLLGRTLVLLERTDVGYRTDNSVLTFRVNLGPKERYPDGESSAQFFGTLLEQIRGLPGVRTAGLIAISPWNGWGYNWTIGIDGRPDSTSVIRATVSDGYFGSLGIPVRAGRDFEIGDRVGTSPVAIISETMARQYWPSASPLGARIRFTGGSDSLWREIVGVVGNVRENAMADPTPVAYVPVWQSPDGGYEVMVQTDRDARQLIPAVRRALRELDPALPLVLPRTMDEVTRASLVGHRLPVLFTTAFAALALLLAALGVYGVMAYTVSAREREFGIRAALGASRERVLVQVLRQGMTTALVGTTVGLVAAAGISRVLAGLLVGVGPRDPATFVAAPLILLVVSSVACLIPARRAMKVEPLEALRPE